MTLNKVRSRISFLEKLAEQYIESKDQEGLSLIETEICILNWWLNKQKEELVKDLKYFKCRCVGNKILTVSNLNAICGETLCKAEFAQISDVLFAELLKEEYDARMHP